VDVALPRNIFYIFLVTILRDPGKMIFKGDFGYFFYSTLLYLPPLRFHCENDSSLFYALTTQLELNHARLDLMILSMKRPTESC
jgi:hypothetical protein